jgi:hypothetical protein
MVVDHVNEVHHGTVVVAHPLPAQLKCPDIGKKYFGDIPYIPYPRIFQNQKFVIVDRIVEEDIEISAEGDGQDKEGEYGIKKPFSIHQ